MPARRSPPARGPRRATPRSPAARPPGRPEVQRGDLYLGGPAVVDVLSAELVSLGAKPPIEVAPGALVVPSGALLDASFARQVLPDARLVEGKNANELAAALLDLGQQQGAVLLPEDAQVVLPEVARRGSRALEEHPLASALVEVNDIVGKKIVGRRDKHGAGAPSGHRLEALLVDTWRAWVSIVRRPAGPALLTWPCPFAGGRALDEAQTNAPSSAHRKLDEALAWLQAAPGEDDLVLDLGAAPGGWSWAALQRGARVIAVDRADLDPAILGHPRLEHVRADAFKYVPPRRPSWLICDVIAEPDRSLDLAVAALRSSTLQGLVVTLKLKRPVPLALLKKARAVARSTPGTIGRVKNLVANKLEVTLMMRRLSDGG